MWSLKEAAKKVKAHPATILRWIERSRVAVKKKKNARGHYVFTDNDVQELTSYCEKIVEVS